MQTAILIMPRTAGQWSWARNGEPTRAGTLEDLGRWFAEQPGAAETVLLVPGEDVLLATVAMPTRNPSRIARALPYAFEEHVLGDPAALHCVAGPWADRDLLSCAAIDRQRLQAWLDELAGQGIRPVRACADALCLPWEPGSIQALEVGSRALVRWGECSAVVCDSGTLDAVLAGIQAANESQVVARTERKPLDEDRFLAACAGQLDDLPFNLLQGEFLAPQRRAGWRSWRLPAALAASVLLAAVVLEGVQNLALKRQSAALAAAIDTQFRDAFPHIGRVQTDPGPQIALELRRLRQQGSTAGDEFLALLGRAAPALAASPALSLERLQYRDGQLELGLSARQIADLDGLRTRLEAAGVKAAQGTARLDNDRVSGTVTISAAAAGAGP